MQPSHARSRRPQMLAVVTAAALVLAACGGDDDDATDSTDAPAAAATTAAPVSSEVAAGSVPASAAPADSTPADPGAGPLLPDRDSLSFGALWETPPVIGVDPADTTKPVGLAPDLADAMAPLLGVETEWQNMQWPAQLPGVQSGTVDALFGQVTITEERELSIVDLVPFLKTLLGVLVPEGNPAGLTQLADACGLTIGVPVGSIQTDTVNAVSEAACAPNGLDPIVPAEYQGASAAISALLAGTIDGWLDDRDSVNEAAESGAGSFAVVDVPEAEYPPNYRGIAVSKDQPEVAIALAEALKALIADGTYAEVIARYGMEHSAITTDEVIINPMTGTEVGVVAEAANG